METTTNNNPFDTQQSSTSSGTQSSTTGIVNSAIGGTPVTTGQTTPAQYTPETRTVDPATQTVSGQVESILAKDSPLMQRARTLATQNMAQRGLVNSSMAQGAGVAAMVDKATPIAAQDASTYNAAASEAAAARNAAAQYNVGQQNQFTQSALDRAQQTATLEKQQQFSASQQAAQNTFTAEQQKLQNQFAAETQKVSIAAQNAQIPAAFASNITNAVANGVNAVIADGNLSAAAKQTAIANLTTYANSQIAWANKFYGTSVPNIEAPAVA